MVRTRRHHPPAPRRRLVVAMMAMAVVLGTSAGLAQGQRPALAGRSLAGALDELQRQGLRIVYSSALVRPEMRVLEEPEAGDPRAILDEILAPHGLAVREGPEGHLVIVEASPPASRPGAIRGHVGVVGDQGLLPGVVVRVEGSDLEAAVGADGAFQISGVPPGRHRLTARSPAYLPQAVDGVRVRPGATVRIRLELVPVSVFLEEIVVTPSHFRILADEPAVHQFLSRREVARMPHVADDLYRAVKRLPGASGGDVSARFHVRGGATDEMLVILDGMELYEPFHLKDFQSVFSTVDAEAVGGVDFLTGGFPVRYGDRLSGVMDISIATPSGPPSTSISLGSLNSRLLSQGTFHDRRGRWLVSGRGWYPATVLDAVGATYEEIRSDYFDVLAKLEHQLGERSTLSLNALAADDDLGFDTADPEEVETVRARYRSHQLWLNLHTSWSERLHTRTVLSGAAIRRDRVGGVDDVEEGTLDVDDRRVFDVVGLKQDWTLQLGQRHLLAWGADLKRQEADYRYSSLSVVTDPDVIGDDPPLVEEIALRLAPRGESYGVYVSDRFRLSRRLVAEVGLRWDKQFWTDDQQLSPRLNLRYQAGPRTTVRGAWGRFHQAQRLNEVQVEDGVTELYPAQLAEHWLASLEHRLPAGLLLRVEAYAKELSELHPRFENVFNPLELFPEAQVDRVMVDAERGRARGVEVLLKSQATGVAAWWVSYAAARAEDREDGRWVPRSWDQRHAVSAGLDLELPRGWNVNLAGTFHSGWPTTAVTGRMVGEDEGEPEVELVLGPRNAERLPRYLRLDLRASKTWTMRRGELSAVLDVLNLTDRRNLCCIEDVAGEVDDDGVVTVQPEYGAWAPLVPSLSVRWSF